MKLPERFGRCSQNPPHMGGKVALVGETGLYRYFADRKITLTQQRTRPLHAPLYDILMNR